MRNAIVRDEWYWSGMAAPRHAWHLKAWLKALGKRQADLARDLDMNKAKVSLLVNQKQPYDQDDISTLAEYLDIQPFELLMHPNDAGALRALRASAEQIALQGAEITSSDEFADLRFANPTRSPSRKTGTHG